MYRATSCSMCMARVRVHAWPCCRTNTLVCMHSTCHAGSTMHAPASCYRICWNNNSTARCSSCWKLPPCVHACVQEAAVPSKGRRGPRGPSRALPHAGHGNLHDCKERSAAKQHWQYAAAKAMLARSLMRHRPGAGQGEAGIPVARLE